MKFLRISQVTLAIVVLNIVGGAAVRLSDSGLGCPDWPTCLRSRITPPLSLHPVVEFGNRLIAVALVVSVGVTFLAALRLRPRRADLIWLSSGLVVGVVGEALLGAAVVYSNLNPYLVMTHFLLGIALLSVSLVLSFRAGRSPARRRVATVDRSVVWTVRAMAVLLGLAAIAGTAATGAGPHAGAKGAKRIGAPLVDMVRVHSSAVLLLGVLTVVMLWRLLRRRAPAAVVDRAQLLLATMIVQGVTGYVQYFSHLPALLVGIHVLGVTVVWSAMLFLCDGLYGYAPDVQVPAVQAPAVQAPAVQAPAVQATMP